MALVEPVPFPFEWDASDRFTEEREHETTIQGLWDGSEQRSSLTEEGFPNRRFSYGIKALDADEDEFQRLQAMLYAGQHLQWWAPYWPRVRRITGAVSAGATAIPVAATAHMGLVVGQGVLLYRSPSRYEVVAVESVAAASIGVAATTLSWTTRDRVVACFRALMAPQTSLSVADVHRGQSRVTFDLLIHED